MRFGSFIWLFPPKGKKVSHFFKARNFQNKVMHERFIAALRRSLERVNVFTDVCTRGRISRSFDRSYGRVPLFPRKVTCVRYPSQDMGYGYPTPYY